MTQRTILLVEDDVVIATLIEDILADAGFRSIHSSSLDEATGHARTADLHAAILDFNVAETSTLGLAETLRERGIPYVFCTGSLASDVRAAVGDAIVVGKPFIDSEIIDAIEAVVPGARRHRPSADQGLDGTA